MFFTVIIHWLTKKKEQRIGSYRKTTERQWHLRGRDTWNVTSVADLGGLRGSVKPPLLLKNPSSQRGPFSESIIQCGGCRYVIFDKLLPFHTNVAYHIHMHGLLFILHGIHNIFVGQIITS